jgi:hypothetical protein
MSRATQFKRTPEGTKTPRMLEVEARIGRPLEDDYREFYLEGNYGQKKLANRWGVKRGLIFGTLRDGRRNWVQMLGLITKGGRSGSIGRDSKRQGCELCGTDDVPLERAHWIPANERGTTSPQNIVLLCPNCHTKLDQVGDPKAIEGIRAALLVREARKLLETKSVSPTEFLALCRQIIGARAKRT